MRNPTALLLLLLVLHMLSSFSFCLAGLFPLKLSFSRARQMHYSHHSHRPSTAPSPAPQPNRHAFPPTPSQHPSARRRGHHQHHHHWYVGPSVTASPPSGQDCHQICEEPLTSTPFGSPCGCVFPMKVRILLNVAPVSIFPMTNELEFEVAAGTYLEQSQVRIMGANADSQNQGRTVVDFDLVPLGEKFDNTTAVLIYERLLHKKVLLNSSLFGDYDVVYVSYPGISSSPQNGDITGNAPSGSAGVVPFSVNIGDKNSGMNFRTIAIIAVSAFVVIFVLIGAGCVLVKWSKFGKPPDAVGPGFASSIKKRSGRESIFSSSIRSSGSLSPMSSMPTSALSVKTFTLPELEKATDKFSSNRILGEGGFGRVYRATMEDGTEAAVKLLTRNKQNRDREFIAEIDMLSRLHHRNLVKLLGICIEGHTRCMVYELVHNGSLESHLHGIDNKNGAMDWDARLKISLGAARGLAYLHEDSNPRVIHRDFKASNVLLEDDFTPKVSDFGLAREATEGSQHISTRVMGTFGYVAPEYAMTGHLLVKSDVYSYGVVLLELLTGRKPVDMSQPQGQENLVTWARPLLTTREGLAQLVDPSLSGTYNFDDMAKVASIASMCVHPEVTHRPFMGEVVQALKLVYNDMDETCGDYLSQKDSSPDSDFKADFAHSETSWWNATPRLNHGKSSSFVTMDYSSGPLEEGENRASSASSLAGEGMMALANRSGPLRTTRSKRSFFRMRGSLSEHGGMFSRRFWNNGGWV